MNAKIEVEVLYARPEIQKIVRLTLPEGSTAESAIAASGLLTRFPEIDFSQGFKLGIYAKIIKADTVLRHRDRVEIYRPLIADPKAVRRQRAEEGKAMK